MDILYIVTANLQDSFGEALPLCCLGNAVFIMAFFFPLQLQPSYIFSQLCSGALGLMLACGS